jgi:hypothetical protein
MWPPWLSSAEVSNGMKGFVLSMIAAGVLVGCSPNSDTATEPVKPNATVEAQAPMDAPKTVPAEDVKCDCPKPAAAKSVSTKKPVYHKVVVKAHKTISSHPAMAESSAPVVIPDNSTAQDYCVRTGGWWKPLIPLCEYELP